MFHAVFFVSVRVCMRIYLVITWSKWWRTSFLFYIHIFSVLFCFCYWCCKWPLASRAFFFSLFNLTYVHFWFLLFLVAYTLAIFWKTWYHFLSPPLCIWACMFARLPLFVIRCTFCRIVWLFDCSKKCLTHKQLFYHFFSVRTQTHSHSLSH